MTAIINTLLFFGLFLLGWIIVHLIIQTIDSFYRNAESEITFCDNCKFVDFDRYTYPCSICKYNWEKLDNYFESYKE